MTNYKLIENCSIINKFNFTELDTTNLNKIDYYKFYIKYLSQKKKKFQMYPNLKKVIKVFLNMQHKIYLKKSITLWKSVKILLII